MAFFKWRRVLLRLGLIFILSSGFLSACTGGGGNNSGAGAEGDGEPRINIEEGDQGNQWNKMTWDAGKWG